MKKGHLALGSMGGQQDNSSNSIQHEEAVVWLVDPAELTYVREPSRIGTFHGRHLCVGDRAPKCVVAYALHPRGCHCGAATRYWYLSSWDPYLPGPCEAVVPSSVQPGKPSVAYFGERPAV